MDPAGFLTRVMCLCFKYRGSVASWGRTIKHNKEVGGVADSYHLLWLGADVVLDDMVVNPIFERDAEKLNLKGIMEGDHYHIQPAGLK